MRLKVERRGGFAAVPAVGERDGGELSAAQHHALQQLLQSPPSSAPSPGADRFHYKVTVEDENGTKELQIPEHAMPEVLADIAQIKL
jgi:hypothetical protein